MVDKGHCKIPYDTESEMMEIVDFYDFRSSYPEEEQRKMREAAERGEEDGEDDEEEELDTGVRLGEDSMELILPSGARLGHRSLNKYYRQNVKPEEVRISYQHMERGILFICTFQYSFCVLTQSPVSFLSRRATLC
jgi:pre-60S factor REI1